MITIQTTCQQCGCDFTPSVTDIRTGTWKRCPPCRDGPLSKGTSGHPPPLQPLRRHPTASTSRNQEQQR